MAYVDFHAAVPGMAHHAAFASRHDQTATPPEASLSALEWSVVAIARNDRLSSLRSPSRMSVALGNVFGGRPSPALADAKLEALRRTAVLSWHHGYSIPSSDVQAFEAAGYTLDHYELLLASIGAARQQSAAGHSRVTR